MMFRWHASLCKLGVESAAPFLERDSFEANFNVDPVPATVLGSRPLDADRGLFEAFYFLPRVGSVVAAVAGVVFLIYGVVKLTRWGLIIGLLHHQYKSRHVRAGNAAFLRGQTPPPKTEHVRITSLRQAFEILGLRPGRTGLNAARATCISNKCSIITQTGCST